MIRDFINNFKVDQVVDPAVHTADADGASVDLQEYNYVTFIALVGESGDTLGSGVRLELEVEDSDDDSTFADAADADVVNYVAGANDGCFGVIDAAAEDDTYKICTYRGGSRYVRPVVNIVGTHSNGIPVGVIAIRYGKNELPVA
jgi:hypothetical protein